LKTPGVPPAEVDLTDGQVSRLIRTQAPALAHRPLRAESSGWDNFMFRLGEEHVVRLPRRRAAVALVEHEQRWLPLLAPRLPLKVPAPVHCGVPGEGYPWPWSICPWIEGTPADVNPPSPHEASSFARFLKDLHQPAPAEAPRNPYRGVPLLERRAKFDETAAKLEALGRPMQRHRELFEAGMAAPLDVPTSFIHGDLHPCNLLTLDGRLSGVIDWGDVAQGDPATDLAALFMLFAADEALDRALRDYEASRHTVTRARAWAVLLAAIFAEAGTRGDARMGPIGDRVLSRMTSA
jgi:aminoglycoside phosphotransferase (APT) family kinase protein